MGTMRVAADYRDESCGFGIEIKSLGVMDDVDRHARELDYLGLRKAPCPVLFVDVAADRGYRRDLLQGRNDLRRADIAGMNDMAGAAQQLKRLRPQQTVRVRDYPDDH